MNEPTSTPMIQLDKDTSDFHQYAAAAVDLSSGHVSSQSVLSVLRSVRNWELNTRQNYIYRINLAPLLTSSSSSDTVDDNMMLPPIPLDLSVQMYLPSPSGKKTVVIKTEHKDGKETDERVVEVWQGPSLIRRIQVGEKTSHGKIINDPAGFGIPSWSPDEEYLLYSAERLPPTSVPFWSQTNNAVENNNKKNGDNDSDAEYNQRGGQSVLGQGQSESWGECYSKQEAILDLYILNLSTGRLGRVQNVPKTSNIQETMESTMVPSSPPSITLGQAVWHPKSSKIVFTGWSAGQPKHLGMVYCRNRASRIYESEIGSLLQELAKEEETENENKITHEDIGNSDGTYTCLSRDLPFSRSPRYVQVEDSGENLVFLASERAFVSHDACMGLYRWDEKNQVAENVIPIVEVPSANGASVSGLGFPGLFLSQLPANCNIDKNYLVTTTLWGSFQRIIRINIKNGDVHLIDIPQLNELGSQSLFIVAPNGDLVISEASCDQPASLWIVKKADLLQEATKESGKIVTNARRVASFSPIAASTFSAVKPATDIPYGMQVLSIDSKSIDGAASYPIQAILLLPKKSEHNHHKGKLPMIVVPHGGPHSCSTSTFAPGIAYLASKYAVLLPNYRGSIGFGQAPLNSLLTRIGSVDVDDVMLCTKHVIENFSVVDGERIGICGGSHGGFLAAHCTSQYPDFFKAGKTKDALFDRSFL